MNSRKISNYFLGIALFILVLVVSACSPTTVVVTATPQPSPVIVIVTATFAPTQPAVSTTTPTTVVLPTASFTPFVTPTKAAPTQDPTPTQEFFPNAHAECASRWNPVEGGEFCWVNPNPTLLGPHTLISRNGRLIGVPISHEFSFFGKEEQLPNIQAYPGAINVLTDSIAGDLVWRQTFTAYRGQRYLLKVVYDWNCISAQNNVNAVSVGGSVLTTGPSTERQLPFQPLNSNRLTGEQKGLWIIETTDPNPTIVWNTTFRIPYGICGSHSSLRITSMEAMAVPQSYGKPEEVVRIGR